MRATWCQAETSIYEAISQLRSDVELEWEASLIYGRRVRGGRAVGGECRLGEVGGSHTSPRVYISRPGGALCLLLTGRESVTRLSIRVLEEQGEQGREGVTTWDHHPTTSRPHHHHPTNTDQSVSSVAITSPTFSLSPLYQHRKP